jgi:hypothetical protein
MSFRDFRNGSFYAFRLAEYELFLTIPQNGATERGQSGGCELDFCVE